LGGEDRVGSAKLFANACDHLRLGAAFRSECVIDSRRLDQPSARGGSKKQQRKAVRTTGDGDPEPCIIGNEPIELG